MAKKTKNLTVETITHDEATRKNIPTAEYQSVLAKEQQSPIRIAYERRNRDLDPQSKRTIPILSVQNAGAGSERRSYKYLSNPIGWHS